MVTDGEFRRSLAPRHLLGLWWIEHTTQTHGYFFHDEETRNDSAQVVGKIRFTGAHPDLTAFKYLKSLTDGTDLVPRQSIRHGPVLRRTLPGTKTSLSSRRFTQTKTT